MVGARGDNDSGQAAGAVHVFEETGTLMRQLLQGLVAGGVPERDTLFVNLEEPALQVAHQAAGLLDQIVETYAALMQPGPRPNIFLDEVHNVPDWARWVRARSESGRACFVVSGSSSQLTEPQAATVLTGRTITRTVWPLSFSILGEG